MFLRFFDSQDQECPIDVLVDAVREGRVSKEELEERMGAEGYETGRKEREAAIASMIAAQGRAQRKRKLSKKVPGAERMEKKQKSNVNRSFGMLGIFWFEFWCGFLGLPTEKKRKNERKSSSRTRKKQKKNEKKKEKKVCCGFCGVLFFLCLFQSIPKKKNKSLVLPVGFEAVLQVCLNF